MPTLVECDGILDCVKVAEECGLDFIEINMSFPEYLPSRLDAEELIKITKEKGIFYTIHADEQLNPFDFNETVSRCYFSVMRECIEFAKKIGVPVINMHLLKGVYVTLPEKVILLTDVYKNEYLTRVKEFIAMCEEAIGDAPLKIAIENVDSNPFTISQKDALALFMQSPVFALTLDVGHDDCLAGADRWAYEKYQKKLVHMHLHDSDGKHPHLPLGKGRLNINEKISILPEDKTCLIEVKTIAGLKESMEFLKGGYKK